MINIFSKQAYRRVFTAIALITVASMAITGGIFILLGTRSSRSFMMINHHAVSQLDFKRRVQAQERRLELLRYQFEQAGIPFDPRMLGIDVQQSAMQSLISDALLNEVAQALNMHLGYEYVANKITDPNFLYHEMGDYLPPYLFASQQGIDFNNITRALRSQGLSVADFERHVEQHLKLQLVKELIANAAYVPGFLLKNQYMQQFAAKKYSVLTIPFERILAEEHAKELSDAELSAFYKENGKQFSVPERRTGISWEFDPERYGITISEEDVTNYYNAHKATYIQQPAQVQVRHILFNLEKPEDLAIVGAKAEGIYHELTQNPDQFAAKAKEFSSDKATASAGGMVGFIARGDKDPHFEQMAFKLKNDGAISPPFQTKDGVEIIQRVSRKPATYKSLSAVRGEVEKAVGRTLFNRTFYADLERVQQELKQNPEALAQFAQTKGAKQHEVANVHLRDQIINPHEKVLVERLFKIRGVGELSIMMVGKETEDKGKSAKTAGDGHAVVIQLTKINKSYVPPFETVKDTVRQRLYRQKAEVRMRTLLAQIRQQASQHSMTDLAHKFHGSLRTIDWLKADETERAKKLTSDGLPVNHLLQMELPGSTITDIDEHHNGHLIKLEAVEAFSEQDFEAKKATFGAAIGQEQGNRLIQGFIASLERSATISVNSNQEAESQPYPIDGI